MTLSSASASDPMEVQLVNRHEDLTLKQQIECIYRTSDKTCIELF